MIEARCIICGCPEIDHGVRALIWGSPARYRRRVLWRHWILNRLR